LPAYIQLIVSDPTWNDFQAN